MDVSQETESCLARMALGEQSAFDQLYDLTAAPLFGMCSAILQEDEAAAKALEEAYTTLWAGADTFRSQGLSAAAWVVSVAREAAIQSLPESGAESVPGEGLSAVLDTPGRAPPAALKAALDQRLFGKISTGRTLVRLVLGAVLGAAAAGAVAFVGVTYVIPSMTQTILEARLMGETATAFSARYESANGSLSVARVAGGATPGRDQQLWLAVPGQPPLALGLLDAQGRLVADLSAAPPEALEGAVLVMSEEALGGATDAAGPGAILAAGPLVAR